MMSRLPQPFTTGQDPSSQMRNRAGMGDVPVPFGREAQNQEAIQQLLMAFGPGLMSMGANGLRVGAGAAMQGLSGRAGQIFNPLQPNTMTNEELAAILRQNGGSLPGPLRDYGIDPFAAGGGERGAIPTGAVGGGGRAGRGGLSDPLLQNRPVFGERPPPISPPPDELFSGLKTFGDPPGSNPLLQNQPVRIPPGNFFDSPTAVPGATGGPKIWPADHIPGGVPPGGPGATPFSMAKENAAQSPLAWNPLDNGVSQHGGQMALESLGPPPIGGARDNGAALTLRQLVDRSTAQSGFALKEALPPLAAVSGAGMLAGAMLTPPEKGTKSPGATREPMPPQWFDAAAALSSSMPIGTAEPGSAFRQGSNPMSPYKIKQGDTLSGIAMGMLGPQADHASVMRMVQNIAGSNGIADPNKIQAGGNLNLPGPPAQTPIDMANRDSTFRSVTSPDMADPLIGSPVYPGRRPQPTPFQSYGPER